MEKIDKLTNTKITRRSLLKGISAAAATGVLAGCSTGDGLKTYFDDKTGELKAPPLPETDIKFGATPHNCGGGCLSKYYTKNGVVRRIVTDEDRPDGDVFEGKAQFRSCLRCRARKEWFYRNDRLTVPLSCFDENGNRVAERGDIKNYVRRTWDKVIPEIVAKQTAALAETKHDPRAIMITYGLGDRTMQNYYLKHGILAGAANGGQAFSQDLSYPQWIYTYNFVDFEPPFRRDTNDLIQLRAVYREGNARADMINADKVVIWSANPAETRLGVNTTYFLNKIKARADKEIVVIDARYTMTAEVYADKFIAPVAGTDAAVVLAMLYHLITETWEVDGTLSGKNYLNSAFIKRYIHGFFDDYDGVTPPAASTVNERFYNQNIKSATAGGKQYLYGPFAGQKADMDLDMMAPGTSMIDATKNYNDLLAYVVPAGMSLSAYILGDDDRLTQVGGEFHTEVCLDDDGNIVNNTSIATGKLNFAKSGYPETIGYNVNDDDPLYGDISVPCYGKIAKTPEWAEKISGVPADTIRKLAEMYASNAKVTTYHGAGVQRQSEGEQFCWLLPILCTATGQFGQEGRSYGFIMEMTPKPAGMEYGAAPVPIIDKKLVTSADTTAQNNLAKGEKWNSGFVTDSVNVGAMMTSDSYPVFTWSDLFASAGTGKSIWNYGKIKNTTVKPKVAWVVCGGPVTQSGNAEFSTNALKNIDTVVAVDIFMTPSVECADYILPAKAVGEKWGMTDGYITSDTMIMQPVSEGPAEAKTEFEIGRLLAKAVSPATGKGYQTLVDPLTGANTTLQNDKDLAKHRFNMFLAANKDMKDKGWTFEKFLERGYFSCLEEELGKNIDPALYGGRPLAKLVARELFRKGATVNGAWQPFERLVTETGKVEAYCQMIVEEYEASHNVNFDTRTNQTDVLGGKIYTPFVTMSAISDPTVGAIFGAAMASVTDADGEAAFKAGCDYVMFMSMFYAGYMQDPNIPPADKTEAKAWAAFEQELIDNDTKWDAIRPLISGGYPGGASTAKGFLGFKAGLAAVKTDATGKATIETMAGMRRFVYPIPMYIPAIEGRHSDDSHPDPLNYGTEFPCRVQSFHFNYRAHSVLGNVSYLAELYKKDANGDPAFMTDERTAQDGAWVDGVYEPVYINPKTAQEFGIVQGDLVKISNGLKTKGYKHVTMDGALYASAVVTEKIAPYSLGMGDSALRMMKDNIDVGGCVNSLYHGRPSRIGFGMSLGSDVRVKIEKA